MSEKSNGSTSYLMKLLPVVIVYILFKFILPAPAPITPVGMEILGIFLMACYMWVAFGTGWPSVLVCLLVVISGYYSATEAIKNFFGDWMFSFLMGCMMVGIALRETGIAKRMATWFITRKFCRGRPWLIIVMFYVSMFILGLGMTSSGTCTIFCILMAEILTTCGYVPKDKFSQLMYCGIAWFTIYGNGMTAIGHGNFITGMGWVEEATGVSISIGQSFLICTVCGFINLVLFVLLLKFVFRADASKLVSLDIDALKASIPPMSRQEIVTAVCFGICIFMWVCNDLLVPWLPFLAPVGAFCKGLGSGVPILMCAIALCIIHVDGKPILDFNKTCKSLAWQSCMMIAAVRFMGTLFSAEDLGISAWLNGFFGPMVSGLSPVLFIFACIFVVVFVTNLVSNSVALVLYKVAAPLMVLVPGVNPVALGICMISAGHVAFTLPACTTTTAYVVGLDYLEPGFMMKHGPLPAAICCAVLCTVGYGIGCLLF